MEIFYFLLIAVYTFLILDKIFNLLNTRDLRILNKIQGFTSRFKRRMAYRTSTGLITLIIADIIIEIFHFSFIGSGIVIGLLAALRKFFFW